MKEIVLRLVSRAKSAESAAVREHARCMARVAGHGLTDVKQAVDLINRALDTMVKGRNDDIEGEPRSWIQVL